MRNFKKVVAAGLALLMLALSVNVSFAAETYTDKEAIVVAKVNAAGIMQGTDKGFEPSKSLTRAEAAAIMVRMKGISEDTVKQNAGTTLFTDVAASHWAAGYINVASNYGIIKGVGAGKFAPEKEVTVAEFYTMAIRALNAGQLVEAEGTWPTNYVNFAIENDLAKDVAQIYTATATRMSAATIVANTLVAPLWEKSGFKSNGEVTWEKSVLKLNNDGKPVYSTILDTVLKLTEKTIPVEKVSNNDHKINGNTKVVKDFDISNIKVGLTYTAWVNEDKEVTGLWLDDENTVTFTAIAKDAKSDKITLTINGEDEEYKIATKDVEGDPYIAYAYINEKTAQDDDHKVAKLTKDKNRFGTAYLNKDDEIISMYINEYQSYAIVDKVTSKNVEMKSGVYGANASTIKYTTKDNEYFLTKDGKGISFADLKEDDAIAYYVVENFDETNDKYVGIVLTDSIEGKVTAKGSDYIKLDGKKYDMADSVKVPAIEDEIIAYTNNAGKIAMWKKVEGASSDVAIVSHAEEINGRAKDATDWEVKLFISGTNSEALIVDYEDTFDAFAENVTVTKDSSKWYVNDTECASATEAKNALVGVSFYDEDKLLDTDAKYYFDKAPYASKKAAGKAIVEAIIKAVDDSDNALLPQGLVVTCYEINGTDVTFKPFSNDENVEAYGVPTDAKIVVNSSSSYVTGLTLKDDDNANYTGRAYLNDNTKIYKIKKDDANGVKFAEVNLEDVDNTDLNKGGIVTDWDYASKTIGTLYVGIDTQVKAVSTGNYAMLEKISSCKYNGESAKEVEVILANGEKTTYYATKDDTDKYTTLSSYLDKMVELVVAGDLIVEVAAGDLKDTTTTFTNAYITDIDSSYRTIAFDGKEYTLDENVLVVEQDGSKRVVRDEDDLVEYESATEAYSKLMNVTFIQEDTTDEKTIAFILFDAIEEQD